MGSQGMGFQGMGCQRVGSQGMEVPGDGGPRGWGLRGWGSQGIGVPEDRGPRDEGGTALGAALLWYNVQMEKEVGVLACQHSAFPALLAVKQTKKPVAQRKPERKVSCTGLVAVCNECHTSFPFLFDFILFFDF